MGGPKSLGKRLYMAQPCASLPSATWVLPLQGMQHSPDNKSTNQTWTVDWTATGIRKKILFSLNHSPQCSCPPARADQGTEERSSPPHSGSFLLPYQLKKGLCVPGTEGPSHLTRDPFSQPLAVHLPLDTGTKKDYSSIRKQTQPQRSQVGNLGRRRFG